ncbi:sortase domain-bontaining protein [Streptomyces sp. NPDC090088]|uniref:sortase domain-containing protein n=1 Tax=Streptomyces sp. NPDC090088 TaxID=3365944 RepID=UPI0037F3BDF6
MTATTDTRAIPPADAGTPHPEAAPDAAVDQGRTDAPPGRRRPATPYVLGGALLTVSVLLLGICAQLVLLSPLEHRASQSAGFDKLRGELAAGTVAVSQTDQKGRLLTPGTPLMLLEIPELHVREVVFEGTDSDVLAKGPGHRRDTLLPGQAGTAVIMGRAAAYGGPFGKLAGLAPGDTFRITTGQGRFTFRVLDLRHAGDRAPAAPAVGKGRVVLMTATGTPYLPSGVLRLDADLVGKAADTPALRIAPDSLPASELPLRGAPAVWWELLLWLQALGATSAAAVWAWFRWGRRQAWIVSVGPLGAIGLEIAQQITRLLPNLL